MSMERVIAESQDYLKVKLGDKMLASTVRLMREKQLITQKQLAFYCKLPPKLIESIEAGVVRPQLKTIKKIAAYFKVPHLTLLNVFGHETPPEPQAEDKPIMQLVIPTVPQNDTTVAVEHLKKRVQRRYGRKVPQSDPDAIRYYMAEKSLTVAEMCRISGLSKSCMDRNLQRPLFNKANTIQRIASALEIDVGLLLLRRGKAKRTPAEAIAAVKCAVKTKELYRMPIPPKPPEPIAAQGEMSAAEFVTLVTKIGKLSDANKRFVMEMVDKLVSV